MADIQTRTFTKHLSQLTALLRANPENCLSLATELTSRRLIPFDTLEKASNEYGIQRALAVLNSVHPVIQDNPDAFRRLVQALKKEEILRSVADSMQREVDFASRAGNVTNDSTAASRAHTAPSSESAEVNPGSWACIKLLAVSRCIDLILKVRYSGTCMRTIL